MRIAFTGSHGVGKTTLMEIIAQKYPDYEVQLESLTRKAVGSPDKLNFSTVAESERLISEAYMDCFLKAPANFISSRHMIDVLAYSMYLEKKNANIGEEVMLGIQDKVEEIRKQEIFDLVMYIPIEFELTTEEINKEFREGQADKDYQRDVDAIIKFLLWGYGIEYTTISGSKEERIVKIEGYLNG